MTLIELGRWVRVFRRFAEAFQSPRATGVTECIVNEPSGLAINDVQIPDIV